MSDRRLTLEILNTLAFPMTLHVNGGSHFSELHYTNKEWSVGYSTFTNGSPNYLIKRRIIYHTDGGKKNDTTEVDITPGKLAEGGFDEQLRCFCDKYNNYVAAQKEAS